MTILASRRPGRPRVRPKDGTGNRVLLRGIDVLKTIARADGPTTLSELSRAAQMSPSRTYRYLESLVESEFARYDASSGRYSLGPAALELGTVALSMREQLERAARPR